jgi:hypothetical protein
LHESGRKLGAGYRKKSARLDEHLDSTFATYIATGFFTAAAVWNVWPLRRGPACPACENQEPAKSRYLGLREL